MKKGEVSNGALAALVVVALIVSVFGFTMIMGKIGKIGYGPTAAATSAKGKVNLSITQTLSFNMTDDMIDFGTGTVATGKTYAWCDSEDGSSGNASGFNVTGPGCNGTGDTIALWNDGNVRANISVTSDENATDFFCEGTSPCDVNNLAQFKYKTSDATYCTTGNVTTYTEFTKAEQPFCQGLQALGNPNALVKMSVYVRIPSDAKTGLHENNVTFTAYVNT